MTCYQGDAGIWESVESKGWIVWCFGGTGTLDVWGVQEGFAFFMCVSGLSGDWIGHTPPQDQQHKPRFYSLSVAVDHRFLQAFVQTERERVKKHTEVKGGEELCSNEKEKIPLAILHKDRYASHIRSTCSDNDINCILCKSAVYTKYS